jgi:hypothetical protein
MRPSLPHVASDRFAAVISGPSPTGFGRLLPNWPPGFPTFFSLLLGDSVRQRLILCAHDQEPERGRQFQDPQRPGEPADLVPVVR